MDPIVKIKSGLIAAGLGAGASASTLAGLMLNANRQVISRANAPFEFWSLVVGGAVFAAFGGCVAGASLIRDRADSDVAALGIDGRKLFQYVGLFCVLAVIYSIYLKGAIEVVFSAPGDTAPHAFARQLLKVCVVSALPFALLAYADRPWRSTDAAPVSVAAWVAVFAGFVVKYGDACPIPAFLLFVPLVFSALAGHTLGKVCNQESVTK
jgi:hypothetical protein